jgi:hypothetical protein
MVNKHLVFIVTKSYFDIDKFKFILGLFAVSCAVAFYSCAIRAYETEEIVEEVLDTQKAASTQKFVPSTDKYDETADIMYEKYAHETDAVREGYSEIRLTEVQTNNEKGPFTIQIGAFVREYRAVKLLNSAKETLDTDIYYELINNQYKVRLAEEYPTKTSALPTLEKLWGLGFYGAFIAKK